MPGSTRRLAAAASLALIPAWAQAPRVLVIDPAGRAVPAAIVEATCDGQVLSGTTGETGEFPVLVQWPATCRVRVRVPGLTHADRRCEFVAAGAVCHVQMHLARRLEHVEVQASVPPLEAAGLRGVGATRSSAADLRVVGPDLGRWIDVAERLAGPSPGARDVQIGGHTAAVLPPSAAVAAIAINDDPFSVERSRTDRLSVDLTPSFAASSWHVQLRPPVARVSRPEPLLHTPPGSTREFGLMSGVSAGRSARVSLSVGVDHQRSVEHPTYLAGAAGREVLRSDTEAEDRSSSVFVRAGVTSPRAVLTYMGLGARVSMTHAGLGGRSGPNGAPSVTARSQAHQASVQRMNTRWTMRVSGAWDGATRITTSPPGGPGVLAVGRLVSGGGDTQATDSRSRQWRVRFTLGSEQSSNRWLAGFDAGVRARDDATIWNPSGFIVLGAAGEPLARAIRQGSAQVSAREVTGAVYAQSVVARSQRLWLRLGVRADWQADHGVRVSPRVSVATPLGAFILAGNAGLFVDPWPVEYAMEVSERQRSPVLWREPQTSVTTLVTPFRRHDIVARVSLSRSVGPARVSAQETMTRGRRLGGTSRSSVNGVLVDYVSGDRFLMRWQTQVRVDLPVRRWRLAGGVSLVRSVDNTDGLFALAARQTHIEDERGPSTGVPGRSAHLSGRGVTPGGIDVLVVASVSSGIPFTEVTGEDPEGLLTFSGRTSRQRNAQRSPGTRDVSLYASRRFTLPLLDLALDAGLRVENLLGSVATLEIDPSATSTHRASTIRAGGGVRAAFWFTLGR